MNEFKKPKNEVEEQLACQLEIIGNVIDAKHESYRKAADEIISDLQGVLHSQVNISARLDLETLQDPGLEITLKIPPGIEFSLSRLTVTETALVKFGSFEIQQDGTTILILDVDLNIDADTFMKRTGWGEKLS